MIYTNDLNTIKGWKTAVAIGKFDGLHAGHMSLIRRLRRAAGEKGLRTVVLSFSPYPSSVLCGARQSAILSTAEKVFLLENEGVDCFAEIPFTAEFAGTEPGDFVRDVLAGALSCGALVVGEDYAFGKGRRGTVDFLKDAAPRYGFEVRVSERVERGGQRVSSSRVRELIARKDLPAALRLMGRPYFIMGRVRRGLRNGTKMGFPTANVVCRQDKLLPPNGVYRTRAVIGRESFESVTNVGSNPTVSGTAAAADHVKVETHIFGFDRDIYGMEIIVEFFDFIRGEARFDGLAGLKNQIAADIVSARGLGVLS